jgi:hypothetical protein
VYRGGVLRGPAAVAILASSCVSGDLVFIDGFPESSASSALLAIHHGGEVDVRVVALPPAEPIRPTFLLRDESDFLELLLYDQTADVLFRGEGPVFAGTGSDPLPEPREIFRLGPFDDQIAWQPIDRKSQALDAFSYDDPRPDPCADLDVEVAHLQATEAVAELVIDDQDRLYAIVEAAPGVFRIDGTTSTPLDVSPVLRQVTATFFEGKMWIATATGALFAGAIVGDRLALEPQPIAISESARWLIPNPFGDGLLALTREAELVELATGTIIDQLPIFDSHDEGSLLFLDGAVWFTTIKSEYLGRWDGERVQRLLFPNNNGGGGVGFVPGIGVLAGSVVGPIFRYDGRELVSFLDSDLPDANAIIPLGEGFIVGSDVGGIVRYAAGRTCEQFSSSVEDLELGVAHDGAAVFAPSSKNDRLEAGGPTPITIVKM